VQRFLQADTNFNQNAVLFIERHVHKHSSDVRKCIISDTIKIPKKSKLA